MDEMRQAGQKDAIMRIFKGIAYLNPALRRVADYILEHPGLCKNITIKELATVCGVAESTVTRFVKEIGLNNFRELKIGIAEALTLNDISNEPAEERHVYEDISRADSNEIILDKVLYRNIQTLTETKQRMNIDEINKAVEAIGKAEVLIFSCMGSSGVAAEEAVMRFTRAGKKCILFRDESIQLMTAAITGPKDVVIGISNSGHSKPVVQALKLARSVSARTIGITSFEDSPLVRFADIKLFTSTKSSPDGPALYWESTTSKTAQILAVDVLYACFAAKHFDQTLKYLDETYRAVRDTRDK